MSRPLRTALIGLIGPSGSGKSTSLRNCPLDRTVIIDVERKGLPFLVSSALSSVVHRPRTYQDFRAIFDTINKLPIDKQPELIVVDSFTAAIGLLKEHVYATAAGDKDGFATWRRYNELIGLNLNSFKERYYSVVITNMEELVNDTSPTGETKAVQRRAYVQGKEWEVRSNHSVSLSLLQRSLLASAVSPHTTSRREPTESLQLSVPCGSPSIL